MLTIEEIENVQHILELETMYNWDAIKTAIQGLDELLKYKKLEEEIDCPLDEAINLLFDGLKFTELYQCITCTSVMHNERGCEGNCEHNKEFSKKEILKLLKKYVDYYKGLKKDKSE